MKRGKGMTTDEKIQKLLEMQEQGESIESICKALELGTSKALSNLANRKGYKFDRKIGKYVIKEVDLSKSETLIRTSKPKKEAQPKSTIKQTVSMLEEEITRLHKLIYEKDIKIRELELELQLRPFPVHNPRGAGRPQALSEEQKITIKRDRLQGKTFRVIAEENGCSIGLVHKIINEIDH